MKQLILLITFVMLTLAAKTEDYNVLWEMDLVTLAGQPLVSDDGKYFYYSDSGFVKFHESETGTFLHKIIQGELKRQINGILYLNDDRVVLPFTLDSILIYNIESRQTEATIDLGLNVENPSFYRTSVSPNKRFFSMYCSLEDGNHIIIVDLLERKLFKDVKIGITLGQLFNTNDPNRLIVTTSNQHGKLLMEITLDGSPPFGYKRNIFEEVDEEGEIRGQKYDADEDAFYYLSLSEKKGYKLIAYDFDTAKKTVLYENFILANEKYWFNDGNNIILFEHGTLRNLSDGNYIKLKIVGPTRHVVSSCEGLETILIREHVSIQGHKLRRIEANDFLTDIETSGTSENYLYPNPTNGQLSITLSNLAPSYYNYELFSNSGQIVLSDDIGFLQEETNNISIDISHIPIGHYILRIFSEHEEFTFNVIKQD